MPLRNCTADGGKPMRKVRRLPAATWVKVNCSPVAGTISPAGPWIRRMLAGVNEVGSMSRSNVTSRALTVSLSTRLSVVAALSVTIVSVKSVSVPALPTAVSVTRRVQMPLGFRPLRTFSEPWGRNEPVNGGVPAVIDAAAWLSKVVLV